MDHPVHTDQSLRAAPIGALPLDEHPAKSQTVAGAVARLIVLCCIGLVLTWFVVMRSLTGYLAEHAPGTALALRGDHPTAAINLADQMLNTAGSALAETPADRTTVVTRTPLQIDAGGRAGTVLDTAARTDVRRWLSVGLARNPLEARALRLMAQFTERVPAVGQDAATAERLYELAGRLSNRETYAVYRTMAHAVAAGDYPTAGRSADTLLRTNSGMVAQVVPVLAAMAEQPGAATVVRDLLASNPPWRKAFFAGVTSSIRDARTPLDLLQALQKTDHPATRAEIFPYLKFLMAKGLSGLAYNTWLQSLTADELQSAGFVYNGSFERQPSGAPFDWRLYASGGAVVDLVDRVDRQDESALFLNFGVGRVEVDVGQTLVLGPGNFRFRGQQYGAIITKRGLRWRVTCLGGPIAGQSELLTGAQDWAPFEFSITVPDVGCAAQILSLTFDARSASEQLATGKIWFDDLAIGVTDAK